MQHSANHASRARITTTPISAVGTFALALVLAPVGLQAQAGSGGMSDNPLAERVEMAAEGVTPKVVEWRRHIHANPELGNREFQTSALVAEHLRSLGIQVTENVAHTGVVGLLEGGKPGPVVALRADMDALPVTEMVDLPFASKVRTEYNGQDVGVMHACGHDNHVAILMGVAEVLAGVRDELPGTVKFIFQPAEEGPPAGEQGGASLMIEEGAFQDPAPEAVFGLHVMTGKVGTISYKPRGAMAAADGLRIVVRGVQTHGAMPWNGIDPIVVSSQIVLGLQTIVSRQSDIRVAPAIVTVGSIQGGVRGNIIPDSVVMTGTIRTYDADMQREIHERIRSTAEHIAAAAGAEAQVDIAFGVPVTWNDPDLTDEMLPTLRRVAGAENVIEDLPTTGAEDFSLFAQKAPGLFLFLGGRPADVPPEAAAPNHSPYFFVDEGALPLGVKAISSLAVDYMWMNAGR